MFGKPDAPPRKALETALSEHAAQLRTAQRVARLGAFVFDVATGHWTSSEMLDEIFGISGIEFDYSIEGWLSLIHPDDRAEMQGYLVETVIGRGERFDREYRIVRHRDGAERWVHGCGELTFTSDGRPAQMIGTIQDCTDRHCAEQALRAANTRLNEMFDGARDPILLADTDTGRILDANRAASVLFNRPKDAIVGMHQADLHPPDARDAYRQRFSSQLSDIAKVYSDTEIITSDGRRVPVEIAASLVPLSDGRQAVQGIFHDLTERKAAEAELLRREARLASVFRAVPVGLFVVAERRFLDASPYVEQLIGYKPQELRGQSVRMLYPSDEEYERIGREAYPQIRAHGECRLETVWCHKDGRVLDILLSAAAIDSEGDHGAITFAALDVTERRRLEAQLRHGQKMEAIGQLAGGVAHDFNNVLTAMLLQLGHLRSDPTLGPERLEAVEDVLRGAHRAADLTRQLLLFGRQQVMRRKALNLNQVIAGLLRMLHRVLGKNIEIQFRPGADEPWVDGDAGMLEQVLMNLCINARDAMPQGGTLVLVTQSVALEPGAIPPQAEARAGTFARLTVADTGTGIPEAILGRIFEPFFTTKDVGHGTGLGLATVLGIVQQHGGWIDVESTMQHGTTFTIHLPVCPAPANDPASPGTAQPGPGRGHETILVVEDEAAVRRPIASLLRRLGYVVLEAGDGAEALAVWSQHQAAIQLVISDVIMPGGMSGIELCQRLVAQRPGLRVIVLSGYAPQADSHPRFTHVDKPCEGDALARVVRELLDRQG